MKRIEDYITTIPDFPEPGIMFRDITSVLKDPEGLRLAVDEMCDVLKDVDFDVIVGLEARGFLFGMPMAYKLNKPFVPIRKRENCPVRRWKRAMRSNTAMRRSRSTKRTCCRDRRSSSSTT